MKIILSPAKQMKEEDGLESWTKPVFQNEAEEILQALKSHTPQERQKIWNCSAKLAAQNERRLSAMDLSRGHSPALFSYRGLAYSYLAADALTDAQLQYLQEHLRILSGLYGVLRPMDGIVPYRLEMAAPLAVCGHADLYSFWKDKIAAEVMQEDAVVVNLASREYSEAVEAHLKEGQKLIHIVFLHKANGSLVTKGTLAKMARGSMVRWLAENQITDAEAIRAYRDGYSFSQAHSDASHYVFLQTENSSQ